jgi:O-antigen/teichoic acid export membrane protein
MQPKVLRSLFFMLFLNLIIKPFWLLGIDRTVQNLVGTAQYGVYYALFNLTFYLQIVLDPGLHTYNNTSIAQDNNRLSDHLSSFLPLKILLCLLYLSGTIILGILTGFQSHEVKLLLWIAVNQALASMILYFRSNLSGLLLFYSDSIFSVLDRLLMIVICSMLIWGHLLQGTFRIEWFVYAQTTSSALTALAVAWVTFKKSSFFRPSIRIKNSYYFLKKSYPFAILTVLMTLYTRVDSLMLERLLPDGPLQAGIYASAYRLLDASGIAALLFAGILLPVFSAQLAKKENVKTTVNMAVKLLYVPGIILVLASFFFRNELMQKLYPSSTEFTATIFGLLMIGFLALCNVYIFGTLLTANGNLRFLNTTAAIGVLGNILLNLVLIYRIGALGAVIATLITQGLVSLSHVLKAHHIFKMKYTLKEAIQFALFLIIALLSFALGHSLTANWVINLLLLTAFNLTFAGIIGLIRPQTIVQLAKINTDK